MAEFVSDKKRIAQNTLILYLRMLFVMIIAFYTSRVILQTLGASDFGIYNVVGGIVMMMAFITGPLNGTTMRFLTYELGKNDKYELTKVFACTLNIHIAIGLLLVLLAETIGLWFFYEKLVIPEERMGVAFWVYQFSIATMFFEFTQIPYSASITAHENMAVYAYVGLYGAISKLLIVILIGYSAWDKLWIYAFLILLNRIGVSVFYRLFWNKELYKGIVSYAGWNIFGGLAVVCEGQGVNILLNLFFGPIVNAARAISFQLEAAIKQLVTNFMTAVRPQIIKCYAGNNYVEMYNLTFKTTKYGFYLMFMVVMPVCLEIKTLLHLWLGNSVPEYTEPMAVVVLVTSLINCVDQSILMSFHAIGKVKFGNVVGGTFMMLTIPLGYLLLYIGGSPTSVFVLILVINVLATIFDFFLVHYYVPFDVGNVVRTTFLPMLSVAIIALLPPIFLITYMDPTIYRMIIIVMMSVFTSIVSVWAVGLDRSERSLVQQYVKKKRKDLFR